MVSMSRESSFTDEMDYFEQVKAQLTYMKYHEFLETMKKFINGE